MGWRTAASPLATSTVRHPIPPCPIGRCSQAVAPPAASPAAPRGCSRGACYHRLPMLSTAASARPEHLERLGIAHPDCRPELLAPCAHEWLHLVEAELAPMLGQRRQLAVHGGGDVDVRVGLGGSR